MKNPLVQKVLAEAKKRLGVERSTGVQRFRHRQIDVWTRAFQLADRNGRIAIGLGILLALSLTLNIVQQGRPANVIFVDQLGVAKFMPEAASPEPPRDYEAESFARTWVRDFLSRDASTAKQDIARALTLTEPGLRKRLKEQLLDSGEIEKARDASVHTAIDVQAARTKRVANDRLEVQIDGQRIFSAVGADKKTFSEPFSVALVLSVVERTEVAANGLLVRYVSGSFGDNHVLGGPR